MFVDEIKYEYILINWDVIDPKDFPFSTII